MLKKRNIKTLQFNAALNVIKQICTILYPLITFPYITRVLGPKGFGAYSYALSIATYFIMIAGLGIKTYATREGAKLRENPNLLTTFCKQIFTINLISVSISSVLLMLLLITIKKFSQYRIYISILASAMFLDTVGTDWINNIFEDFLYLTIRYIIFVSISIVLMFGFVKQSSDLITYCIISVFASYGGNLINVFYVRRYVCLGLTNRLDLKKHLRPLLVLFANTVAVTIYVTADMTMLGIYKGDYIAGVYGITSRIYTLLKNIVYAVVIVSIPRVSYCIANQKAMLKKVFTDIFSLLNFLMIPIIVGMICLNHEILLLAGGEEYLEGKTALIILGIAILLGIYSAFFSDCVLIPYKRENKCLIATSVTAVSNVLLNLYFIPVFGLLGAAITTLIAETTNCIIQYYFARRYITNSFIDWKNIRCVVIGTTLEVGICIGLRNYLAGVKLLIISMAISMLVYIGINILMKNPVIFSVRNLIKKSGE